MDDTLKEKLNKLHISSLLELALIIPSRYEDYRLHTTLRPALAMLLDATIENVRRTPSSLQLDLFAHNFSHKLKGVLFHPKPYMRHQFTKGSREYLYGMIDCKSGICSIQMPKKIAAANIGAVSAIYKTPLRNDVMQRLVKDHLNLALFLQNGIDETIAKALLELHFPNEPGNFPTQQQLYALKYLEIFLHLRELQKKRTSHPSMTSSAKEPAPWLESLPFTLTKEQRNAIENIRQDLQKNKAAKRMIVGDVGSGKTMVILATAYMNHPNKTILMAPTTILAQQLFEEAKKLLPSLKTVLITNKNKKENLHTYDFIIGTHALLYRELPKASVVMVDEQHRFGTKQRVLLSKMVENGEKKPHFFQFSATPIPRTQALIDATHIDVSLITSTPFTKNITTKVIGKQDFKELLRHINAEIEKNHQILIIYPLVEESEAVSYQSIDEARSYWEKNFQNVYITHGKDKEKEHILREFKDKGEILIATTVVEVGISLPRLSTIIIVGAERLGLATLHQLRGRVSRTGLKGYCYLYSNLESSPRLEEFAQTTNGFEIAQMDLKYRQSGDLLKGEAQSGKAFRFFEIAEDEAILQKVLQKV